MKLLTKYAVAAITVTSAVFAGFAQDDASSSSSIVRRRGADDRRGNAAAQQAPGVTDRMQEFYKPNQTSDADKMWMRVIYRDLELDNPKNA